MSHREKELELYIYNDDICFTVDNNRKVQFFCRKHRTQLLLQEDYGNCFTFVCASCEATDGSIEIDVDMPYQLLEEKALTMYDSLQFKNAKLIRLDDIYVPELKIKNIMGKKVSIFCQCKCKDRQG